MPVLFQSHVFLMVFSKGLFKLFRHGKRSSNEWILHGNVALESTAADFTAFKREAGVQVDTPGVPGIRTGAGPAWGGACLK